MRGAAPGVEEMKFSRLRQAYSSGEQDALRDVVHEVLSANRRARVRTACGFTSNPRINCLRARKSWRPARRMQMNSPFTASPFAVKDNIDVAGCFRPRRRAPNTPIRPRRVLPAWNFCSMRGAIFRRKGRTWISFALGPSSACARRMAWPGNPFHPDYVPGGSSSGSAVAVAAGTGEFRARHGTRQVRAVCRQGFQQHRGDSNPRGDWLARGAWFPACRTLDCVSVLCSRGFGCASCAGDDGPAPDGGTRTAALFRRERPLQNGRRTCRTC